MGDLQWYEKVREIRTEWAHYSTAFIGLNGDEPVIVVSAYRRGSDKKHFDKKLCVSVPELIDWTERATATLESFAVFLCREYVIPSMDMNQIIRVCKVDSNGVTIITPDSRFDSEEITVAESLRRFGIIE